MTVDGIAGLRILIVEDEYLLADDARTVLTDRGASVLGPVATLEGAEQLIAGESAIDGVLLDVNLRGVMAYDVADTLRRRGIPFAFITGYDCAGLPSRFADVPMLQKPTSTEALVRVAADLASARPEIDRH